MYCSNCKKFYEDGNICPYCGEKKEFLIDKQEESHSIYKKFRNSIENWPETKQEKASKFINKSLKNQLERLNKNNLTLKTSNKFDTDIFDKNFIAGNNNVKMILDIYLKQLNNSNQTFSNQSFMITGVKTSKYYKKNKLLKKINFPNRLFTTVTSVNDQEKILEKNYTCPNCGNIIQLSKLLNGCEYCHSKFLISDLYPIVTNYYHSSMEIEKIPFKKAFLIIFMLLSLIIIPFSSNILDILPPDVINELNSSTQPSNLQNINPAIYGILFSAISAFLFSFMYIFIRQIVLGIIYYLEKNEKKKNYTNLENFIKQNDPNFTYYLFEGKIISMLKEIIFSENPNLLTIYSSDKKIDFSNIIDTDFLEMYINKYYEKDNQYFIDLKIKMYNTLYQNNKIIRKKQSFYATVSRNKNVYTTSNLRIDNINCKSCGAIVDIEKDKCCKYCNSPYDLKEYDFVITDLFIK